MRLEFVKKTSMPNAVKSLGYSRATNRVASDLLTFRAIRSNTTVRRSQNF